MMQDRNIMKYTSKIVIGADYARSHGIVDIDGRSIPSHREFKTIGPFILPKSLRFLAKYAPSFVRVPNSLLAMANSKYA
jgi:hypothetical protein